MASADGNLKGFLGLWVSVGAMEVGASGQSWGGVEAGEETASTGRHINIEQKQAFIHSGLPSSRLFILPQQTPSFSLQVQNRGLGESSLSNIQRVAEILSSN